MYQDARSIQYHIYILWCSHDDDITPSLSEASLFETFGFLVNRKHGHRPRKIDCLMLFVAKTKNIRCIHSALVTYIASLGAHLIFICTGKIWALFTWSYDKNLLILREMAHRTDEILIIYWNEQHTTSVNDWWNFSFTVWPI